MNSTIHLDCAAVREQAGKLAEVADSVVPNNITVMLSDGNKGECQASLFSLLNLVTELGAHYKNISAETSSFLYKVSDEFERTDELIGSSI